ncbi:Hsp70 family protein [Streptomyces sp. NBC_01800]|uniref:Hsp70 family protein n=1 Tax=Streptomyces sp. NBC_01800 TaxID=2975945 RepID=UPI002DDBE881|nr:Hsp70 family protein [Streptomyces sp. NBC_01800]WSA71698.1 Hsp70 family protein [Streptomyces sp. NBC_01800]
MHRTLGIDLGTTNSVVAWMKNGTPEVIPNADGTYGTPSAVGITEDGGLLVGQEALHWLDRDAARVVSTVKRFMGRNFADEPVQAALARMGDAARGVSEGPDGGVLIRLGKHLYTPVQISAIILRRLKRDAEDRLGVAFDRTVITAPAYFGERQLAATREAGELAGLHVVRVLKEPTSAALAHGLAQPRDSEPATIVVYDLGGGTFDVSVLTSAPGFIDVMAVGGDNLLGGTDFDGNLAAYLKAQLPDDELQDYLPAPGDDAKLRQAAEQAKIRLSESRKTEVTVSPLGVGGITLEHSTAREAFEELISEAIDNTVRHTTAAVSRASQLPEDVDQVLLVGGSSSIPLVSERLAEVFGEQRLRSDIDPMRCVALGAAIQSALLDELDCADCHSTAPVDANACPGCDAPLTGVATVECPVCHVPAQEGSAACPVCSEDLSGLAAPSLEAAVVECSHCGQENPLTAMACDLCEELLAGHAGLKCPGCGLVNAPGLQACSYCDREFPVSTPMEVTALPFGVQLKDGTLRVLVEADERYPTDWHTKDFHITGNKGDMLEILLWEGSRQPARLNDFCAGHTHEIKEDISGTRPLVIRAKLNNDRLIDLEFRIDNGGWHTAQLNRHPLTNRFRTRVLSVHRDFATFVADWTHSLTAAEQTHLKQTEQTLRALLAGGSASGSLDSLLDDAERQLDRQKSVRWASALAQLYPMYVPGLMSEDEVETMRGHHVAIGAARKAGDLDRAHSIAHEILAIKERLGDHVYRAMSALASASQDRVSSVLRRRIVQAGEALTEAARQGDTARLDAATSRITELYQDVQQELSGQRAPERQAVLPEDATG